MNVKQTIQANNKLLKQIKFRSRHGSKQGSLRIHKVNTLLHENVKFQVMYWLMKHGYIVYSECEFKDESGRADIIAIQKGQGFIIEILASEKEKKYLEKESKYPTDYFTMVKVDAKTFKYEDFCL